MTKKRKKKSSTASKKSTSNGFHYPSFRDFWNSSWKQILVLTIACFALYTQTLNYEYVLDDKIVITDNSFTNKGFAGIWDLLSTESMTGYFGEQKDLIVGGRYRPLSLVTFALEEGLWGSGVWSNHLINLLLYLLTGFVLLRIFKVLIPSPKSPWFFGVAFLTCLIFVVHPLHTEAVANIKGRDEIMALLFGSLSLLFMLKAIVKDKYIFVILSSIMFFLGLLSKENIITYLAVIPLTIYFFSNTTISKIAKLSLPLLVTTLIYLMIRYQVIGYLLGDGKEITDIMNNPFVGMSSAEKSATIAYTLGQYLKLSFLPHPLTHDYYPYHIPIMNWGHISVWISAISYLVLSAFGIWGLKSKNVYAYCILAFLIPLSIVSNIIFPVGTFMNERFLYVSSLASCLAMGYFLGHTLYQKNDNKVKYLAYGLATIIIIGYSVKSMLRIPAWKNTYDLNAAAIKVSKNSARANVFMASAIYENIKATNNRTEKEKWVPEGYQYANRAHEIIPEYYNANLLKAGLAAQRYQLDQNLDELFVDFKSIANYRPDLNYLHEYYAYLNGRESLQSMTRHYIDVAETVLIPHVDIEKRKWAVKFLTYANELNPTDPTILGAMSKAYRAIGQPNEADYYTQKQRESMQ